MLAEVLWAFMKGDFMRVAKLHREVGWIPAHVSVEQFAQAARAVGFGTVATARPGLEDVAAFLQSAA